MEQKIINKTMSIKGMTCINCQNKIEKKMLGTKGVLNAKVSYEKSNLEIAFDENIVAQSELTKIIDSLGYKVSKNNEVEKLSITQFIGILFIILAIFMILRHLGILSLFSHFPTAVEGMGYGMLFLIGVLTSIHCVAMCGGINLSQCLAKPDDTKVENKTASLMPSFLYNSGRVISYTIVGGIVGGIGSVVAFNGTATGLLVVFAGIFMIIMGLNMLNIFPALRKFNLRVPKGVAQKINTQKIGKTPFYVGLLNGLMPCGPLQAMQVYALSTGDPLQGALSMFFFSMGTIPLMFGFGAISSMLSKNFTSKMMNVSAILVVVLGIFMFSNGMNLTGISIFGNSSNTENVTASTMGENVQNVTTTIGKRSYEEITVQKGVPVHWVIQVDAEDLTGCNQKMVIQEYGIEKQLVPGENVIEFTPTESGVVPYSCWMGMVESNIIVE